MNGWFLVKRSGRFLNGTRVLIVKPNKLTVKVDRPKLSEEDIKKLDGRKRKPLTSSRSSRPGLGLSRQRIANSS